MYRNSWKFFNFTISFFLLKIFTNEIFFFASFIPINDLVQHSIIT